MEQRWTLDEQGMRKLRGWLVEHGATMVVHDGDGGRLTVEVKPDPKCEFCGVGEVHHGGLCLFCHRCLPSPVAHDRVEGNYAKEQWMNCFRDTVRRFHEQGPWK